MLMLYGVQVVSPPLHTLTVFQDAAGRLRMRTEGAVHNDIFLFYGQGNDLPELRWVTSPFYQRQ